MFLSKKLSLAVVACLAVAVTALVAFGGERPGTSPAHGEKFNSGLTPVQTKRVGNSTYAEYAGGAKAQRPAPHARTRERKVTARAAAAEQAATFSVLGRDQTAGEAADPVLQTLAVQRSDLDTKRARALDASRKYWLLPTNDGQVCLGQKTNGPRIFAMVCGYDDTVAKTGLAQRLGDDLTALVPDGAADAKADDGASVRLDGNLLVAGRAAGATFKLGGRDHRVSG